MPFYLRTSVSAGPFRFNFSKGGVGVSVGVRGLRIGTGPRGHYIHAGAGGIYYRSSLGRAGHRRSKTPSLYVREPQDLLPALGSDNTVQMVTVGSGDALRMRDVRFSEILDEINEAQAKTSKVTAAATIGVLVTLALFFSVSGDAAVKSALVTAVAAGIAAWFDSYQRAAVLFYDLDPVAAQTYEALTKAFDELTLCSRAWYVGARGDVRDLTTWKRNAGASSLVNKHTASLGYSLPRVVRCNITPPCFHLGSRSIYLLPDAIFVVVGRNVGAVTYPDLSCNSSPTRFIEDGSVPSDAQVVDYTWQHPNKNGGPDRRFSSNRRIPICLYDSLNLSSHSGVYEQLQFSRLDASKRLVSTIQEIAWQVGPVQSPSHAMADVRASPNAKPQQSHWLLFGKSLAVCLVGIVLAIAVALISVRFEQRSHASLPPAAVAVVSKPTSNQSATSQPAQKPAQVRTRTLYTIARTNMRAQPSITAPVVRGLNAGTAVAATGIENGWWKVSTASASGWIREDLLSVKPPAAIGTSAANSSPTAPTQSAAPAPPAPVALPRTPARIPSRERLTYRHTRYPGHGRSVPAARSPATSAQMAPIAAIRRLGRPITENRYETLERDKNDNDKELRQVSLCPYSLA